MRVNTQLEEKHKFRVAFPKLLSRGDVFIVSAVKHVFMVELNNSLFLTYGNISLRIKPYSVVQTTRKEKHFLLREWVGQAGTLLNFIRLPDAYFQVGQSFEENVYLRLFLATLCRLLISLTLKRQRRTKAGRGNGS